MQLTKDYVLDKLDQIGVTLNPRQDTISLPILNRICMKMKQNLMFKPICVSSESIITEGHHRYIGSILTGYDLEIVSNYPKPNFLNVFEWKHVNFVDQDFDTPYKVRLLNKEDAFYNNLTVEEVESIIS